MSHPVDFADSLMSLRQRALSRLTVATATNLERTSLTEAMSVLHQLASSPATAGDALALLHELQVHQVELDLQQEELRNSRADLEAALGRQVARIERAPAGFITIDARTVMREINPAGARLLGAAGEELLGRPLAGLLSAPGVAALQGLLARARVGEVPAADELRLLPQAGVSRSVQAVAEADTTPDQFLLVLIAVT